MDGRGEREEEDQSGRGKVACEAGKESSARGVREMGETGEREKERERLDEEIHGEIDPEEAGVVRGNVEREGVGEEKVKGQGSTVRKVAERRATTTGSSFGRAQKEGKD